MQNGSRVRTSGRNALPDRPDESQIPRVCRSHCDCDERFYNCLKADRKSIVSVKVGTTYFNLLRPRCFRAVNPCFSNP